MSPPALAENHIQIANAFPGIGLDLPAVASQHTLRTRANTSGYYAILGYADVAGSYAAGFFDGLGNYAWLPWGSAWASASDVRLKKNIIPISGEDALQKLGKVKGVTYSWRKDPSDALHLGVIAQDVLSVYPEAVSTVAKPGEKESYYGVEYTALIGPMISAINELNKQNTEQKKLIEKLRSDNFFMLNEIKNLQTGRSETQNRKLERENSFLKTELLKYDARLKTIEELLGTNAKK